MPTVVAAATSPPRPSARARLPRRALDAATGSPAPTARPTTATVPTEKVPNTDCSVHTRGPATCMEARASALYRPSMARSTRKTRVSSRP
jgi:hypothetical protein